MAGTKLNEESSRSHTIFTIKIISSSKSDKLDVKTCRFCIVDLAGAERSKKTGNTGARLVETSKINSSLFNFRTCIKTLRSNQKAAASGSKDKQSIPFRESKLTRVLSEFFARTLR
eukprot:TRINITY_DN2824_c0_g1_i1.p1 TRINITY_DN2824_c0_g1~~TRINITY_DN2824_c0_g1_i1.p1  ORF type:complete len:116 (+),score=17.52 TRINITY_DN2824_c0_g1_i1:150-497(+)